MTKKDNHPDDSHRTAYILKRAAFSFLLVNTLYWCSIQLLQTYCAPSGFKGFLTSFWTSQHPMCRVIGTIHTSMDQMMLTWPGMAIGAMSFYVAGMIPLS